MKDYEFQMLVRRLQPMSKEGYKRLNKKTKLNYRKTVYVPLKKVVFNTSEIYDQKTLARYLMLNFGPGTYDALRWKNRHLVKGQLFQVEIYGTYDNLNYDFNHIRIISRYVFWLGD